MTQRGATVLMQERIADSVEGPSLSAEKGRFEKEDKQQRVMVKSQGSEGVVEKMGDGVAP